MYQLTMDQMAAVSGGADTAGAVTAAGAGGVIGGAAGVSAAISDGMTLSEVAAAGQVGGLMGSGIMLAAYGGYAAGTWIYDNNAVAIGDFIDDAMNFLGSY